MSTRADMDHLAVVLSTAVDGIIIISETGMIEVFSSACERLFGYETIEVMGKNVKLLMPEPYHGEHDSYISNYITSGQKKVIGIGREVVGRRKDGSMFPIELSIGESRQDGRLRFVGIIRDISERKSAEKDLRESEERLRAVIETAVDGVIIIDSAATIRTFNPACQKLFGYGAEEVLGKNVKMLMPEPYRAEHDSYIQNYRNTGIRKIIGIGREVTGKRKDATTFPMELSVGEAQQNGEPVFVGIIRDISERKASDRAVQRSVDELAAFAYSVAHDLKAPLRAIEGFSVALQEDYGPGLDGNAHSYLQQMASAATRMGGMIDDLLEYSRVGRDDVDFVELSPLVIVHGILRALDGVIKGHQAVITVAGEWGNIRGVASILASVFQNLIENAIKFSRPGTAPVLDITCKRQEDGIEIDFADHGIGIPADCHEKIFQIFHRLHSDKDYPGTGIGLSIVKKGVSRHGGRIEIASTEGEGTTISVFLPFQQTDQFRAQ